MKPPKAIRVSLPKISIPNRRSFAACVLLTVGLCTSLTGCFGFLKPSPSIARHFVLTPLPPAEPQATTPSSLAVGIGQVKLPAYLFNSSMAVRKGTNEIDYSQSTLWAERLDIGIQRVLAADLATLLRTQQVRLSSWRSEDVSVEVYVAIEQFDVDARGEGVLVARWRIVAPGGENLLRSGESRFKRQGPSPDKDPSGAVATLSELLADLGRELAQSAAQATPKR